MIRVGFTGTPGAGKTTISRALAASCRHIDGLKHVELVQEYARRYLAKHGEITSILEQYRVLEKQTEWEDSVSNEKLDLLITDSPIFLGFVYCVELPKSTSKEMMFFNDIFKRMVKLNYPEPRYEIIFHLRPVLKPVDDGIRPELHFNEDWRKRADMLIQGTMEIFKPKNFYVMEQESLEDRIAFCLEKIKQAMTPSEYVA